MIVASISAIFCLVDEIFASVASLVSKRGNSTAVSTGISQSELCSTSCKIFLRFILSSFLRTIFSFQLWLKESRVLLAVDIRRPEDDVAGVMGLLTTSCIILEDSSEEIVNVSSSLSSSSSGEHVPLTGRGRGVNGSDVDGVILLGVEVLGDS